MQHFIDKCNKALAEKLQNHKGEMVGLRTTERVRTAIQWRLEMIIHYMSKPPEKAHSGVQDITAVGVIELRFESTDGKP